MWNPHIGFDSPTYDCMFVRNLWSKFVLVSLVLISRTRPRHKVNLLCIIIRRLNNTYNMSLCQGGYKFSMPPPPSLPQCGVPPVAAVHTTQQGAPTHCQKCIYPPPPSSPQGLMHRTGKKEEEEEPLSKHSCIYGSIVGHRPHHAPPPPPPFPPPLSLLFFFLCVDLYSARM